MNIEETEQQVQSRAPNRLLVEEPTSDDNSICLMHSEKMKELKVFNGEPVLIKGKRRNKTLVIAIKDDRLDVSKIAINKVVRNNLKIKLGDLVTVTVPEAVPDLKKIHILPYQDTIEGITGDLT